MYNNFGLRMFTLEKRPKATVVVCSIRILKSYLATFTRVDSVMKSRSFIATHSTENLIISIKFWKRKNEKKLIPLDWGVFLEGWCNVDILPKKIWLGRQNMIFVTYTFCRPSIEPAYPKKNDVNNPTNEGQQYILHV